MATQSDKIPDFDDIVFEIRNKDYGGYVLRRRYSRNVNISVLAGTLIMAAAVIFPYLNARKLDDRLKRSERQVEIRMENLDQVNEIVKPPPVEPPPPKDVVEQSKYIPPMIVDSVRPEDNIQLMTADQAQVEVQDEEVLEIVEIVKEEIQEEEPETEPFFRVEEMPLFPGGEAALMRYLIEHTQYPEVAKENNIQGKVYIKFCVTASGGVDKVSVFKGVDPELDTEAIRVVKSLPLFSPGKQGGKPVPVWFTVPINFQLM